MKNKIFKIKNKKLRGEEGQAAMISVVFFLFISLAVVGAFSFFAASELRIARTFEKSKQSYIFAEGAMEDAVYRIRSDKNMPSSLVYQEGDAQATITVTDIGGAFNEKEINIAGVQVDASRKLKTTLIESEGAVFNYGSHVGEFGLQMDSNARVNGNVFSNGNITGLSNSVINGDAIAVGSISSPDPQVSGTKTESADPIPLPNIDIDYWKAQANINSDPIQGDVSYGSGSSTLGPRKIEGNLSLSGQAILTVTGALHITGNFSMDSNTQLHIDESFGSQSLIIVVDGTVLLSSNSAIFTTASSPKGYLVVISLDSSASAIEINSNSPIGGVAYAMNGWLTIDSNGEITAVVGKGVYLNSNAELNYDLGLADIRFSGGPSGGWGINSWKEIP